MNDKPTKQLLSVVEVAAVLGLGISTVWRQVKLGNLPEPVRVQVHGPCKQRHEA